MYTKVSISEDDRSLFQLPSDYIVGQSDGDGSCFLDSFRQGLQGIEGIEPVTVKTLRKICADVGRSPPHWLRMKALMKFMTGRDFINPDPRSETPAQYVKRVLLNGSWCEPEIEGRILCAYYNVNLVVLEVEGDLGVTRSLITGNSDVRRSNEPFYKPKTIYIINRGRNHFEPLLQVSSGNQDLSKSAVVEENSAVETGNLENVTKESEERKNVASSEPITKPVGPVETENLENVTKESVEKKTVASSESITKPVSHVETGNLENVTKESVEKKTVASSEPITKPVGPVETENLENFTKEPVEKKTVASSEPITKPVGPVETGNLENVNKDSVEKKTVASSESITKPVSHVETENLENVNKESVEKKTVASSEPITKPIGPVDKSSPITPSASTEKNPLPDDIRNLLHIHKFEKVHHAIINCDLKQLEESLAEHQNVLHSLPLDQKLVQLSLRQAMLSSNTRVVDLLYEHWARAAQTSHHNNYIQNLKQLDIALTVACHGMPINQVLVDAYCIIEYNTFQIQLYRELLDLQIYTLDLDKDNRQQQLQQIKYILITAIDLYIEFSDKCVSLSNNELLKKLSFDDFLDTHMKIGSSYTTEYALYSLFELYFRKLDFCIVSIILKYVHALKLRLKLPEDSYQEVECTVYYFIYRWNEDWRIYLPKSWIQRRNSVITSNNPKEYMFVLTDPEKAVNGPLVYLEWSKFKESVTNFRDILEQTSIPDNIRVEGTKLPNKEVHSLTLLPYLRDEYSLQKMVKYLEACSQVIKSYPNETGVLIVQRVIQIMGEFIKSSPKTLHLSPTTKALLQIHIPRSVFQHLITLRDDFSHLKYGKFIRRIHLEETNPVVFLEIVNDLDNIKDAINKVIDIYKPIVEKSLIDQGLNLVAERQKQLPVSLSDYVSITQKMFSTVGDENYVEELMKKEDDMTEDDWAKLGITKNDYKDHRHLVHHTITLKKERVKRDNNCLQSMINYLPIYLEYIQNILTDIEKSLKLWDLIKNDVKDLPTKCSVLDDPNKESIKNIKLVIKKHSRTHADLTSNLQTKLDNINIDWSFQWNTICEFMQFIVQELSILKYHPKEIKKGEYTSMLTSIVTGQPDALGITKLRKLLDVIKQDIDKYCLKNKLSAVPIKANVYHYRGLERLTESMAKKSFITTMEASYLRDKLSKIKCKCSNNKCAHQHLVDKILCGEPISPKERDIVTSQYDLDDKCKENIENLVIGNNNRNGCSLQCVVTRTKTLKNAFGTNELTQLVQRFNQDMDFRLLVEAIIADIQVVFVERGLRRLLDTSTSRLLVDYPLRNILEHGNPLLDVIGEKLDSSSAVDTLFKFALLVVEDEPISSQLFDLYKRGVKHDQIQKEWKGPVPSRLQDYLMLLPNKNHDKPDQCVNKDQSVTNSPKTSAVNENHKKSPHSAIELSGNVTVSKSELTIPALTPKSSTTSNVAKVSKTSESSSATDTTRGNPNGGKITNSIPQSSTLKTESTTTNYLNTSVTLSAASSTDTTPESLNEGNIPNLMTFEAICLAASSAASAASAAASAASAASAAAASAATACAALVTLLSRSQSHL